ncbi:Chitinase A precursor [Sodalis glossinidius str. 'morsitans']|uniref:chitinase n=1 Tax=Sodalis glossinidius (strain morsitans) TaxID=343509 RepID=Q2NSX6_SODGM|nr:glycosyl hydrolase family 18 protein [Sodalis glossinidius]BAE74749.1 exochitinase [Sodalis glossinidius str. 'morsitans']CRL45531.1 Chitinase A precursor [Sodalis glossinidius str. 'morsitans']
MSSQLIQKDQYSDESYQYDGFDPKTNDSAYSYTSARVMKRVYNKYDTKNKPKVFGYYTDWGQYDGRALSSPPSGSVDVGSRGRGVDFSQLSPTAYDKIIFGFTGIVGDKGANQYKIEQAAAWTGKKQYEMTILDPWGDCQAYFNNGFSSYKDFGFGPGTTYNGGSQEDCFKESHPNLQGVLGALLALKKKAALAGHDLALSFSVGGWTMSEIFHEMVKSDQAINTFVSSIVDFFQRFPSFSEIDIDWEYPNAAGAGNPHGPEDGANYQKLIAALRQAFNSHNRQDIKISIASSANVDVLQHSNIKGLLAAGLYGINVMTYDFFGTPWHEGLTNHTNLYKTEHSSYSLEEAVTYLLEQGVDPDVINVGYAGYSRSAKGAEISSFSPLKGTYEGNDTTVGTFESGCVEWYDVLYNYLDLENKSGRNGYQVYTDDVACADYLYSPTAKVFHSIDTPRSVREKARYVIEKGLGGIFTWTIDYDNGLLVNAAREGLGCPIVDKVIDMSPFYFKGINITGEDEGKPDEPNTPDKPAAAPVAKVEIKAFAGSSLLFCGQQSVNAACYEWSATQGAVIAAPHAEQTAVVLPNVSVDTLISITLAVTNESGERATAVFALTVVPKDDTDEQPETPDEPETPSQYQQWIATQIYTEGNLVSHKGVDYRANHWSQGDEPGLSTTTGQYGFPWSVLVA